MSRQIVIMGLYQSLMINNSFSNYLKKKGYNVKEYTFFHTPKKQFFTKKYFVLREIICLIKLLFNFLSFRNKKVVCFGGFYATLIIIKIFGIFLGNDYHLFIYNFYIHKAGESKKIQQILSFLFKTRKCTLIVQSPKEIKYYRKLTNIPIHFVPYCAPIKEFPPSEKFELPDNKYVFSGGYTNRDYKNVLLCAEKMPELTFVLAISILNTGLFNKYLPSNVIIYHDLKRGDFELLVLHAAIVLIPLEKDVGASGQMLCLSAMQKKKAIVYSDISAVNYYLKNGGGVPYILGDVESMKKAINKVITNQELRENLGEKAYKNYTQYYTSDCQNKLLFNIIIDNHY